MTGSPPTGESDNVPRTLAAMAPFGQNTKVQDARCEGYDSPYERSAVVKGTRRVLPSTQPKEQCKAPESDDRPTRYALRVHLKKARDAAASLERASMDSDWMGQAEAGLSLLRELQEIWRCRHVREEEWGAAVSFLQSALAQEEFERFGTEQCQAVRVLVNEYLAGGAVDREDVVRARMLLRRVGFDPWKAISAAKDGLANGD